jgi:hypothetical protein
MDHEQQNMMSGQSTPVMQKMQFKMHHQRLKESEQDPSSMMLSPMMDRRIGKSTAKAMSALDLTNGQRTDNALQATHQNNQLSLMLHQQQKFPHHNHPMEQQMYQQFNQKPAVNQLMKVGPNHNASLADFRSIIHNQSVDDLIASRDQINAIVNAQKHSDYIVSDYMDKIQTRIALLETELNFADRKLHVLYSEYNEMLGKIEKLENLTIAQQSVLANLMDLCSNQSQETSAAKIVQAKAALFGVTPQDILMNRPETHINPFQQEVMVDSTQTEFNEMLEDLKNEAIIDGLRGASRLQAMKKNISSYAHPENLRNFDSDADIETLMALMANQHLQDQSFQFFQDPGNNMTDDKRDTINQHLLQQQNAMELLKNLNLAQLNMEMDFFRSGELNKNLFSSLATEPSTVPPPSLDMIYEDNEEKQEGKESTPMAEKTENCSTSKKDEGSIEKGPKKSKGKKKKHHQQQMQQQHLQLQLSDDQLIIEIVEEVLKIEGMSQQLSKNQLDELKTLVKNNLKYFQNLKKLDNNFLSLLVNSSGTFSPINFGDENQKFVRLISKVSKNLETLKKLDPEEQSKSSVGDSIYNDDEYFQSLKKSLNRHNSMQLLLHMQHPNLQAKSPSVLSSGDFLSDDQLEAGEGSSSPPPPAPNGDSCFYYKSETEEFTELEQEWNPFHVDIMMMKEQKKKEIDPMSANSLSPYRIGGQRSPKNTKSDSGLSSMSGFSSFEKSPNSPSSSLYDQLHQRINMRPTTSSQDYLKILANYQQMKAQSEEASGSAFLFSDLAAGPSAAPARSDTLYSEENLNYIKELSQNVPICSIYENKSIFDNIAAMQAQPSWETYEKSFREAPNSDCMKAFPDLIMNQDENKPHSSQRLDALMEQKKLLNQQKLQLKQEQLQQKLRKTQAKQKLLTDHLVYYPSPMSISDYNSSMSLEYQREEHEPSYYHRSDAQNVQHDEFMQNAYAQQQIHLQQMQKKDQQVQQHPNGSKKAGGSDKASYLNKVHAWLPEIKLKKMSKRHRSQSLPGEAGDEEGYSSQSYKMNLKKHSIDAESGSRGGKKKEIYVMKSYMKGKKKQLAHTMSSIMNKAKVYRRHSFSHHMSDDDENKSQQSPIRQRTTRSASSAPPVKRNYSDTETDVSSIFSDGDEMDMLNDLNDNERNQHSLFATMGDSLPKHSDTGDSDRPVSDSSNSSRRKAKEMEKEKEKESQPEASTSEHNSFNLNFSSTSMEFAVSRKVGIFRKKSSVTDEQPTSVSPVTSNNNFIPEKPEALDNHREQQQQMSQNKKLQAAHMLTKTHSIFVDSIDDDNTTKANGNSGESQPYVSRPPIPSPRSEQSRSNSMRGNSLDVPGCREDEDNKSQQSFRTISSRRQSTEDSIDTDDEYFYYEMRNLEELERNSHMESILQEDKNELINNIIQLDNSLAQCEHEPDESVKKQMSYVLHELKAKVQLREVHNDSRQDLMNNNKKNIYDKFSMATNIQDMPWNRDSDEDYDDHMDQINQIEMEMKDASYGKVKKKRKKTKAQKYSPSSSSAEEDIEKSTPSDSPVHDDFHLHVEKMDRHSQSSGVTSGPDSPIQSDDETGGNHHATEDYGEFKQRQKNERLLEHLQPPNHRDDDRGANESTVQSNESAAKETELKSDSQKPSLKKLMQLSSTVSTDSTNQDSGISDTSGPSGVMSSKWKLLKTLKERKEMNNQVKITEEDDSGKKKPVSVTVNMLKNFKKLLFSMNFRCDKIPSLSFTIR